MDKTKQNLTTIKQVFDMLRINTDTDNIEGVQDAQKLYMELAKQMGFDAKLCAEDKNGNKRVVEIRPKNYTGEKEKLGLVVHLDTVPIGEGWSHDPYGEIDQEGRVYGRGVIDDKAPAVQTLQVLSLLEGHISPDWVIICGSSEEAEWVDMEAYLEEKRKNNEELPDFSITIDGDGVQNGCRGYLDLKLSFARQTDTKNISEFGTAEGAANNSVPDTASTIINGETLEALGKACHSSIPQNGINAIIELARKIKDENPESYEEFKNFFDLMEKMGESYDAADTLCFPKKPSTMNGQEVGYTSSCPTTCRLDGDEMTVNLNIRLMAGTTMEEVQQAIENICKTYNCKAEISELNLPAFIPVDNPSIKRMLEAYEEELGKATKSEIAGGIGYNAALPRCAIFGPRWAIEHDEEDTCHSADETRTMHDMVTFMNMLSRFVRKEIPSPELDRLNDLILKMQALPEYREMIQNRSKEYTPSEINMMSERLINPDYEPPEGSLEKEKQVIDAMRPISSKEIFSSLTPEQLAYIVNETIVSHELSETDLSLEQFTKISPIIFVLLARYNDEETKAQGLLTGDKINDMAFLKRLRKEPYTSSKLENIRTNLGKAYIPIVTEKEYGSIR